jgi:hypothetical protein
LAPKKDPRKPIATTPTAMAIQKLRRGLLRPGPGVVDSLTQCAERIRGRELAFLKRKVLDSCHLHDDMRNPQRTASTNPEARQYFTVADSKVWLNTVIILCRSKQPLRFQCDLSPL